MKCALPHDVNPSGPNGTTTVGMKVAIIVVTAVLYAIGKWMTAFIPTPWGVGQLLIGIFLPAFMAVTSDTIPVAVGAGLGTFLGDFFVQTNPTLSLIAGVPANFVAFLLFGWFVKRYRSWPSFVAATVVFVSLGNLIAAINVYLFAKATIGITLPSSAIVGLTVFWNTTSIPAILIAVPILVRAARPLYGRSRLLPDFPQWPNSIGTRGYAIALGFALAYTAIGAVIFLFAPSAVSSAPGLAYFVFGALLVALFGSISSLVAGASARPRADVA
jgi:hypothetical protein